MLVCRGAGARRLGEVLEPKGEPALLLQPIHQPVPVGDARARPARRDCECKPRDGVGGVSAASGIWAFPNVP